MLKYLIIIISIVILSAPVFAQAPDTLWTRTYGGAASDIGFGVQQTEDGGFIVIGYTNSNSAGMSDIYLLKTDDMGDTLWTRKYGGEFADSGWHVLQTEDGGYILVCVYGLTVTNVCLQLIKTDENGDTLWTRTHPDYSVYDYIRQTEDGGYIIAGSYQEDAALLKTDAFGEIEWLQTYNCSELDGGQCAIQTSDGGYILTGLTTQSYYGQTNVLLVKTDAVGDTIWTRSIGENMVDFGFSVLEDDNGDYVVTGLFNGEDGADIYSDVYLIKVDVNGDTLWTKSYGRGYNDWGASVVNSTDGGYVVTGTCDDAYYSGYNGDLNILKTDADGNEEWYIWFGGEEQDHGECIQKTTDGGYIVVGSTISYGAGSYDVWLLRLEGDLSVENEPDGFRPIEFGLSPAYPNPFNQSVRLNYMLPAAADIRLVVYDITGREVEALGTGHWALGQHSVVWDASGMGSGVYFVRLSAVDGQQSVKKVVLMK